MKNLCKIIFFYLVLSLYAEAQPVTWQRTYNYNGQRSAGRDVVQTFDGGYNSAAVGVPKKFVEAL